MRPQPELFAALPSCLIHYERHRYAVFAAGQREVRSLTLFQQLTAQLDSFLLFELVGGHLTADAADVDKFVKGHALLTTGT